MPAKEPMSLTNNFNNLRTLSTGEHSLEEVLRLSELQEEKPHLEDGQFCSICGKECEVEFDEDWEGDEFVILPFMYCPVCKERRI